MTQYFDQPRGILPRATGLPDHTLNMGQRKKEELLSGPGGLLGIFYRQAVANPGVTQRSYFEENGYEYEKRATYNEKANTLTVNTCICPVSYGHHIGQTCSMCGQKD